MASKNLRFDSARIGRFALLIGFFVPGGGHIILNSTLRGLCLFAAFGLLVDGVVVGVFGATSDIRTDELIIGAGVLAVVVWAYSLYDVWRRAFGRYRESMRIVKYKHFRTGLVHYLGGDFESAVREFRRVLKMDDEDIDALYYLGLVAIEQGNTRAGLRTLRRCRDLDSQHRWEDELARHLNDT